MVNYGEQIKTYRKKRRLSQTEFGKLFYPPVRKAAVCNWEHNSSWSGSPKNKRRLKELINFQPYPAAHTSLGEEIKLKRIELGYTQQEFSQLLFPSPSRNRVADWENSKHNPSQKYRPQLMKILNVTSKEYCRLESGSKIGKKRLKET